MNALYKLLFFIVFATVLTFSVHAGEKGIEVMGSSKISLVPDIARFTFSIDERGSDLASVKREVDKKTAQVIKLCKKLGIKTKDISSSEVSIRPQYNYQTKKLLAYAVSREIKVTLYALEKYTALVNGSIQSGITTIRNISLDTTQRTALELKALEAASSSAKTKASALAKSLGVSLDEVIEVKESGMPSEDRRYVFKANRAMVGQAADEALSGAFEPGEISVRAAVVIRFSIK